MANCNPPVKGQAFVLSASLYTTAGALITNPGTLTLKISKDFGDWGDAAGAGASEEDSTYGQVKIALNATDMNADVVDVYLKDDTSGCVAYKATIYTCSATRGLAGTALPDAAADAVGGLPISDAGGLDLDTLLGHLDEDVSAAKTLTGDYDAAKTAAQAGDEMDLVDAPNSTALGAIKDAVQGAGTTLATLLSRIVGTLATGTHNPQSGDAYARIGANGASLTALGDTRLANLDAAVSTREAAGAAAAAVGGLHDFDPTTDEVDVGAVKGVAVTSIDDFKADVSGLSTLTVGDLPSEPPSAATVADAVWDEALAGHTGVGTAGAQLAAAGAAGDPWSTELPGDYAAGTAGNILGAQLLAALAAAEVTVTSPVATDGSLTIYQGDGYLAAKNRQITFAVVDASHYLNLDDATCEVQLRLMQATWTPESVTQTEAGYTIVFEPTFAETAALTALRQQYQLRAVYATDGTQTDEATLATGTATLTKEIPEVTA